MNLLYDKFLDYKQIANYRVRPHVRLTERILEITSLKEISVNR